MAKRKRLSLASPFGGDGESGGQPAPAPALAGGRSAAPVAHIAGDAATRAALDELADEMRAAREGGRLVVELPLEAVEVDHLTRDRLHFDSDDMAALKASLRSRGQQTPIEVVALADGRHGLISGARRMTALAALRAETGEDRFGRVLALVRPVSDAAAAYLAMVEENEIRADLSFYERARLADEAARLGLHDSPAAAVKALFVHAPPARRSKILNFVALHRAIGPALRFPHAIPEKLGLALARLLETDQGAADRVIAALCKADPQDVSAERAVLDDAVARPLPDRPAVDARDRPAEADLAVPAPGDETVRIVPGICPSSRPGRAVLTGKGVDAAFLTDLAAWLETR